jgi:hypothetical protein
MRSRWMSFNNATGTAGIGSGFTWVRVLRIFSLALVAGEMGLRLVVIH